MRTTGIVRKVDDLGRIVLPRELRKTLSIESGVALEIFTDKDTIMLKKYEPGCIFCGEIEEVKNFKGKYICKKCLKHLGGFKND